MPIASLILAALLTTAAGVLPSAAQEPTPEASREWSVLPVRIHLLRAEKAPDLNSRLGEKDARRILGKVNGIWKQAGIQFYPESIRVEEASAQFLYASYGPVRSQEKLPIVRPHDSRSDKMFHLYYINKMGPNGICFYGSPEQLFIKETAELAIVKGGIDEPLPRVSAHEMGHALGLPHRQDRINLMASGTTGTELNAEEIEKAKKTAEKFAFRLTPAQAVEAALKLPAAAQKDLLETVAAMPVPAAETAKEKLSAAAQGKLERG